MNLSLRLAIRIDNIVSQRVARDHVLGLPTLLHDSLQSCVALDSKVRKARIKGLAAAERAVHRQLIVSVNRLAKHVESTSLKSPKPDKTMGVKDIYADIKAVEEEFGGYTWCHNYNILSVITGPIEMKGIPLGSFKIALNLSHFGEPFDVEGGVSVTALDANCSSGYPHPHVSEGGYVCLGEGLHTIRKAVEEGRVLDYFIILKQILNSYDAEGAYKRLEHWGEEEDEDRDACADCGYDTTEATYCEPCDQYFCCDCYTRCESCDDAVCESCSVICRSCATGHCPGCAETKCNDCGGSLCGTCSSERSCEECSVPLCEPCAWRRCRDCGTTSCRSCADAQIGDGGNSSLPGQCSDCKEKCDGDVVRQSGENDLGQAKDQPEFKTEEVFGATPGFLPEPITKETDATEWLYAIRKHTLQLEDQSEEKREDATA